MRDTSISVVVPREHANHISYEHSVTCVGASHRYHCVDSQGSLALHLRIPWILLGDTPCASCVSPMPAGAACVVGEMCELLGATGQPIPCA